MYERLKPAIFTGVVIASATAIAYQEKVIALWGAYLGMSIAIAAAAIIFLLRRD